MLRQKLREGWAKWLVSFRVRPMTKRMIHFRQGVAWPAGRSESGCQQRKEGHEQNIKAFRHRAALINKPRERLCCKSNNSQGLCHSDIITPCLSKRSMNHANRSRTGVAAVQNDKLENVSIASEVQLKAARRRAVPIRFNYDAHAKFKVAQPIRCRLIAFSLLICYVTLSPWPLTLDFEHLQCISPMTYWYSVPNLIEIEQSAAELLRFEYLTLWPWTCVTCSTM